MQVVIAPYEVRFSNEMIDCLLQCIEDNKIRFAAETNEEKKKFFHEKITQQYVEIFFYRQLKSFYSDNERLPSFKELNQIHCVNYLQDNWEVYILTPNSVEKTLIPTTLFQQEWDVWEFLSKESISTILSL